MRQIKKLTLRKVEIEQSAILNKKDMMNIIGGGYLCWCCIWNGGGCVPAPIEVPDGQTPSSYCPDDYICAWF